MCGIAGVVGGVLSAPEGTTRMLTSMAHRGPDGFGVTTIPDGALGMVRLRLRGASDVSLPFQVRGQTVAYNGEVYGLAVPPPHRSPIPPGGSGEIDLLLDARLDALPDGMWAYAAATPTGVQLGRDPFGIKPLFLRRLTEGVAFASELRALLAGFGAASVRHEAIEEFICFGRVLPPGTFYDGIERLAPGACVNATASGRVERIKRLPRSAPGVLNTKPETLIDCLHEAVGRCLRASERPLAIAASGGVDSSLILACADAFGIEGITIVSLTPSGTGDGLRDLASLGLRPGGSWRSWRLLAEPYCPHDFPANTATATALLGEPTGMSSAPLYVSLANLAHRAGAVALLLGEGADELFAGYDTWVDFLKHDQASAHVPLVDGLARFFCPADRYVWAERLLGRTAVTEAFDRFRSAFADLALLPPYEALRAIECCTSLEALLQRTDHILMAESIEGRTPFLHGLVPQFAFGLGRDLIGATETKPLLRRAAEHLVPAVALARKRPFRAPLSKWLAGPLASWLHERTRTGMPSLRAAGLDPQAAHSLSSAATAGDPTAAALSFHLVSLVDWLGSINGPASVMGASGIDSRADRTSGPQCS